MATQAVFQSGNILRPYLIVITDSRFQLLAYFTLNAVFCKAELALYRVAIRTLQYMLALW